MSIAKILVPVAGAECDVAAIATAIAAARPFSAHIELFAIHEDPALAVPLVGVPLAPDTIDAIIEGQTRHGNDAATRARATMREICGREAVRIVPVAARGDAPTCSFRQCWGNVATSIGNEAALSDLVVLGPICWDNDQAFNEAFLDVLRDVRRPILVARGAAREPRRIAIGWDGSEAAAHAVASAMPFLERAEAVTILTIACRGAVCASIAPLGDYLTRHGVAFGHRETDAGDASAGEALLAAATGADMLVAGAYGHDHLGEALFGGATETLAGGAGMPVLLAH
ncbi:MAG: universal stress protein [Rhizomicrobium sp.]